MNASDQQRVMNLLEDHRVIVHKRKTPAEIDLFLDKLFKLFDEIAGSEMVAKIIDTRPDECGECGASIHYDD